MKKKYFKKDKKAKKSKAPKNAKKIVKAKKAARRIRVTVSKELAEVEPGSYPVEVASVKIEGQVAHIDLAPIEPEALADAAQEAQEPTPDVEVPA